MKFYLYILLIIILFSCEENDSSSFISDSVIFHSKFEYNKINYFIGIKTSGFHDKVQFIELYKGDVEVDERNTIVSNDDPIISSFIEFETDDNFRALNEIASIKENLNNKEIIVNFDDGNVQVISFENTLF